MKKLVIPRIDKALWFGFQGAAADESIKTNQFERIAIEFIDAVSNRPALLGAGFELTASLKASRNSNVILASCGTWEGIGTQHVGWLDLRNNAALALLPGAEIFIEVAWKEADREECSDDPAQKLFVKSRLISGDETLPEAGDLAAKADYLYDGIVCDDASIEIVKDSTNGRIIVRSAGGAGGRSAIVYDNDTGYASTTVAGQVLSWPVSAEEAP